MEQHGDSSKISDKVCPHSNRPLMEIDHYGEVLVGCIDCNRWGHPGDERAAPVTIDTWPVAELRYWQRVCMPEKRATRGVKCVSYWLAQLSSHLRAGCFHHQQATYAEPIARPPLK